MMAGMEEVTAQQPKAISKSAQYPRQENVSIIPPAESGIIGAVVCGTLDNVREMVSSNKASLNSIGPEGLTPLQVAIRNNRLDVAKLLVELGADVDARGAKNRTACLVACQTGSLAAVHLLFENDCDFEARDDDGRSCMHYAAVSPAPTVIHYLQYVADISLLCVDSQNSSPLHIAARHPKFCETLDYLVEQNVYDLFGRDKSGSTPLHYAAQSGNSKNTCIYVLMECSRFEKLRYPEQVLRCVPQNCYRILIAAKERRAELLRLEDKKGNSPLFLSQKSKRFGTKKFSADLLAWSKYGVGHAWFHWFSHLLFTPIAMTFFLIALSSLPEYITFFLAIIAPILFYRAFRDLTRMPHVSRWPSPLQYGTFLAGGFHSVICYFGKIFEVIHMYEGWSFFVLFNFVVIITALYLLWCMLRADPGACKDCALKTDGTPYAIEDVAADMTTEATSALRFCSKCSIVPPAVTKHCRLCEICVENFDHHCTWLNRCIGYLNIRLFVFMLIITIVSNITFCAAAVKYIRYDSSPLQSFVDVFELFTQYEPWVCWMLALNVISAVIVTKLLFDKLIVLSFGCTSYFDQNGQRYAGYGSLLADLSQAKTPTHMSVKQRLMNLLIFFTTKPVRRLRKPVIAT